MTDKEFKTWLVLDYRTGNFRVTKKRPDKIKASDIPIDIRLNVNSADFEFTAGVLNIIAGAIEDDEIDDNITLTNITQITNRKLDDLQAADADFDAGSFQITSAKFYADAGGIGISTAPTGNGNLDMTGIFTANTAASHSFTGDLSKWSEAMIKDNLTGLTRKVTTKIQKDAEKRRTEKRKGYANSSFYKAFRAG